MHKRIIACACATAIGLASMLTVYAEESNSGLTLEPVETLEQQLEKMSEDQRAIATEKYYAADANSGIASRASWYQLSGFYMPKQSNTSNCVATCCYAAMRHLTGAEISIGELFGGGAASLSSAQAFLNDAQSENVYVAMASSVSLDAMKANFYTAIAVNDAPPIISANMVTADGWPYALSAHAMCISGITSDRATVMVADSYIPWVNSSASTQYTMPASSVKSAIERRGIGYIF